ncbi:MAG TPA: RidA family protein [Dehalococcoidia bacterium]|nr:RidA family protein [Dehalococcoidia bacterium]
MPRQYVKGTWQEQAAFSPAVITRGGRIIWVAGHVGTTDAQGNSLAGDFAAQARQTFRNLEATLEQAGGKLKDIVTMTVFLLDVRHGPEFLRIRSETFGGDFPASALVTVAGFATPEIMLEIQAIAVTGEE